MTGFRSQFVVLVAAAGLAASQDLSSLGLSQQCQDTLTSAIANPDISQCLNIFNAINIFSTTANTSVIQPVDSWLQGVCAAPACSNDTLSQAAQNITTGCQSDLSSIGISSDDAQSIVSSVLPLYPTIRKVACLADNNSSNHTLCVTELLTDLQNADGTLSINNIVSAAQGIINGNSSGVSVPKNVTCNDCTEAAWAIIKQDVPQAASNTQITGAIASQCGSDFVNASQPADIVESSGKASTSSGAAIGGYVSFNGFVGLAVVPLISALAGTALLL